MLQETACQVMLNIIGVVNEAEESAVSQRNAPLRAFDVENRHPNSVSCMLGKPLVEAIDIMNGNGVAIFFATAKEGQSNAHDRLSNTNHAFTT